MNYADNIASGKNRGTDDDFRIAIGVKPVDDLFVIPSVKDLIVLKGIVTLIGAVLYIGTKGSNYDCLLYTSRCV